MTVKKNVGQKVCYWPDPKVKIKKKKAKRIHLKIVKRQYIKFLFLF